MSAASASGREDVLLAMCELFKAAHRGELSATEAQDKLIELELGLDPLYGVTDRAALARAQYKERQQEGFGFMAELERLGRAIGVGYDNTGDRAAGGDSAGGALGA